MKIGFISDTHCNDVDILPCDIICHTGDATNRGTSGEIFDFINWYRHVEAPIKLFVPGNHDFICEDDPAMIREHMKNAGIEFLAGREYTANGIKFYGHPWVPQFYDWAYMPDIKERQGRIDVIPNDTDILLSHGPPYEILDFNGRQPCGDQLLYNRILEINPIICAFGHIHEGYGYKKHLDTLYINSSQCPDMTYYHRDKTPIYINLDEDKKINDIYYGE